MSTPLLKVEGLKKYFPIHKGIFLKKAGNVHAVDDLSFEINPGETLGIVGESGCGKSTLAKTLIKLYEPTEGKIYFEDSDISTLNKDELKKLRSDFQMIFQDPFSSLDPRLTVQAILTEPFEIHKIGQRRERIEWAKELLDQVGLPQSALGRYPHEFSGGQRQRLGIARAIALKPKLILCDEPVSALDVSVQSQILNLLVELQEKLNLSYLFIAHDLSVVKYISDKIAVMYLGKIVEIGDTQEVYKNPKHPYTKALMDSIPLPDPSKRSELKSLDGEVPSPINPPKGCYFHPRCPYAQEKCKKERPILQGSDKQRFSCHFPL